MHQRLSNTDIEHLFFIDSQRHNHRCRADEVFVFQQSRLGSIDDETGIHQELARISRLSVLYEVIVAPEKEHSDCVRRGLAAVAEWKITTPYPLLLTLLDFRDKKQAGDEEIAACLHLIDSYLLRRILTGTPGQALSRIFAECACQLTAEEPLDKQLRRWLSTGRRRFVTDNELLDAVISHPFYLSGRREHRAVVLAKIERSFNSKEPVALDSLQIEHVMPQTLNKAWRDTIAAAIGNDADVSKAHGACVHTLGNLTLTGYNQELGNLPFAEKKQRLSASGIRLSRAIISHDRWGPEEIVARGQNLARHIASVWPGPVATTGDNADLSPVWIRLREVVSRISPGSWTTYGNLAEAIGSGAQAVGNHLATQRIEGGHRVMRADGAISSSFRWIDDDDDRDPCEVLRDEGLLFDEHLRADPSSCLTAEELVSMTFGEQTGAAGES